MCNFDTNYSIGKISTVFGGVAIIPCLISAYNFKGPNGGGQQLALWDFNGSTAFPLLVTTMIGWLWTFFLIGHAYLALSDPYRLLDKLQEKDFKKWWNIFAADTYAPIFTDILTCLLAWGAAGVSTLLSLDPQILISVPLSPEYYFTNCSGVLVFDVFSDSSGPVLCPGNQYHGLFGMWTHIHVLVLYSDCHSARGRMYAPPVLPN